ncbi:MAG TPA: hypothetical protein VF103_18600 [Polyangiaceae bacterium]
MNGFRKGRSGTVFGGSLVVSLVASLAAAACGGEEPAPPPTWAHEEDPGADRNKNGSSGDIVIDTREEPPGPHCADGGTAILSGVDRNRNDRLDRGEVTRTDYACNGEKGDQGDDGESSLIETKTVPAGSASCATGGTSLSVGVDGNGNGKLDPAEVASTRVVCNGAQGPAGPRGRDGEDGEDGLNGLVVVEPEPAGSAFCVNGGQEIRSGLDRDRDGRLDADEVSATEFVCNGATGARGADGLNALVSQSTEPSGANCSAGGVRIDAGLDADRDGELDEGEITSTSYACNGSGGGGSGGALEIVVTAPPCGAVDPDDEISELTLDEGETAEVCVSLSAAPSSPAILGIEGSPFGVDPLALTFTASNFDVSRPITLENPPDGDLSDTVGTLTLDMTPLAPLRTLAVTLSDPDEQRIVVSDSAEHCAAGSTTATRQIAEGGTNVLWVRLAFPPVTPPETITAVPGSALLSVLTPAVAFTADDWNVCRELTVRAGQDADANDTSVALLLRSDGAGGPGTPATPPSPLNVVVVDDDRLLTINVLGGVTVSSTPAGLSNCTSSGGDCSEAFPIGTQVQIGLHTDNTGNWGFQSWSGATCPLAGTREASLVMSANATCNLEYWPVLGTNVVGEGTITRSTGITCTCGRTEPINQPITLTATPAPGWQFDTWGGACTGTNPVTTVVMSAPKSCGAVFVPIPIPEVIVEPSSVVIDEDGSAKVGVRLSGPPPSSPWLVNVGVEPTIATVSPNRLSFDASNFGAVQQVTIKGTCDLDFADEQTLVRFAPQDGAAVHLPVRVNDTGLCF